MLNTVKGIIKKIKGFTGGKKEYRDNVKNIYLTEEGTALASDGYRGVEVKVSVDKVGMIKGEYVQAKQAELVEEEIEVADIEDTSLIRAIRGFWDFESVIDIEFKAGEILDLLKRLYKAQGFTKISTKSAHVRFIQVGKRYELRLIAQNGQKITVNGITHELNRDVWFTKDITDMIKVTKTTKKKEMNILLNAKYLLDALSMYEKKEVVTLRYAGSMYGLTIIGEEAKNLILPIRESKNATEKPLKYIDTLEEEINKATDKNHKKAKAMKKETKEEKNINEAKTTKTEEMNKKSEVVKSTDKVAESSENIDTHKAKDVHNKDKEVKINVHHTQESPEPQRIHEKELRKMKIEAQQIDVRIDSYNRTIKPWYALQSKNKEQCLTRRRSLTGTLLRVMSSDRRGFYNTQYVTSLLRVSPGEYLEDRAKAPDKIAIGIGHIHHTGCAPPK